MRREGSQSSTTHLPAPQLGNKLMDCGPKGETQTEKNGCVSARPVLSTEFEVEESTHPQLEGWHVAIKQEKMVFPSNSGYVG